jgi:hypothetical protein
MRKFVIVCILLLVLSLSIIAGCGGSDRKLVSKPVVARPVQTEPVDSGVQTVASEPAAAEPEVVTAVEETPAVDVPSAPAGKASCNQLTADDLVSFYTGTWAKTSDCPKYPMMPKGVSVCQCSFDGPKQLYVNLETQLYDSATECQRVFKMYCSANDGLVGDQSCTQKAANPLSPNFVFFMKGNYFVKVSCLGGTCPLEAVGALATKVDAKI